MEEEYLTPPRLDGSLDLKLHGNPKIEEAKSFQDMARQLVGWIHYASSGAYEHCTSVLRDMYYIAVAEQYGHPYWPQFTRLDFARRFPNYLTRQLRKQLYQRLAKALHTEAASVAEDLGEAVVYIPPFSTLVFNRCQGPGDLPARVMEVREEYAKLRRQFAVLETERRNAKSIGERLKMRARQQRLLEDAAKGFDRQGKLSLGAIVRYVPEVIKPVTCPADPTKYSADLFLKPVEWLLDWWRRRPISALFNAAGKLKQVRGYEALIAKLFGGRVPRFDGLDWGEYLDQSGQAEAATELTPKPISPALEKYELNSATAEQLQSIPGVGPVLAQAIISRRPFKSIHEIEQVRGVGKKTFLQIAPRLKLRYRDGR